MKWLTKVSKRWNHHGERCMKYEMGLGTGCVWNRTGKKELIPSKTSYEGQLQSSALIPYFSPQVCPQENHPSLLGTHFLAEKMTSFKFFHASLNKFIFQKPRVLIFPFVVTTKPHLKLTPLLFNTEILHLAQH